MTKTDLAKKMLKFLLVLLVSVPSVSYAVDAVNCSRPPTGGYSASWARAYKEWCESCCGTFYPSGPKNPRGMRCDPGSNWGCKQQGPSYAPQPSYDYEAERQRQLEAERQRQGELEGERKKEEEEAKRRQEGFEKNKQEALKQMKEISDSEFGLKDGLKDFDDTTPSLPIKEPSSFSLDCEWGNMGSNVVDLRCLGLDPEKPITVDPNVVRGKERVFPAQPDPMTFENVNYQKGFEALTRFDVASASEAVTYFRKAQEERPNDPLVRNALLLAQDILKARQQKEENDQAWATFFTLQSYAALMMGDYISGKSYIAQARKLDPNNNYIKVLESYTKRDLGPESTYPEQRRAYRMVVNSLFSIVKKDTIAAVSMLETAQRLLPADPFIDSLLEGLRKYEAGRRSVSTGKGN